jgi:hypothetical protein
MKATSRESLAWLAGILDGEGYITPGLKDVFSPRIRVAQNDPEMLERIKAITPTARINGPYLRGVNSHYELNLAGFEATQAVIAAVWPWLGTVKRHQAAAALKDAMRNHRSLLHDRLQRPVWLPALVCRHGHLKTRPGYCQICRAADQRRYYFRVLGTI